MNVDQKYELLTRHLQEVLGEDIIKKGLQEAEETGKPLRLYWGTAPTGRPHLGYFVPLSKIADFLKAGVHVVILLADVHAFLDNLKAPIDLITHRANYYKRVITSALTAIGVPTDRLEFVLGSSYQYEHNYNLDKYKLCAITSEHDARKAGAEVVKQTESPPLSGLLYPLLQALDEEYLNVEVQFGGVDQRKIFTFAEANLPKLGYRKRAHLMNPMVPGLAGSKMSSSDPNSKIDFLDTPAAIKKKIKAAYAAEEVVEGNGLLSFIKFVLMPVAALRQDGSPFVLPGAPEGTMFSINRKEEFGGPMHFATYEEVEKLYATPKALHPGDLKAGVQEAILTLLKPIQDEFNSDPSFAELERLAYPPPEAPPKKVKQKKVNPRFAHLNKDGSSKVTEPGQEKGTVPEPPVPEMQKASLDEAQAAADSKT